MNESNIEKWIEYQIETKYRKYFWWHQLKRIFASTYRIPNKELFDYRLQILFTIRIEFGFESKHYSIQFGSFPLLRKTFLLGILFLPNSPKPLLALCQLTHHCLTHESKKLIKKGLSNLLDDLLGRTISSFWQWDFLIKIWSSF